MRNNLWQTEKKKSYYIRLVYQICTTFSGGGIPVKLYIMQTLLFYTKSCGIMRRLMNFGLEWRKTIPKGFLMVNRDVTLVNTDKLWFDYTIWWKIHTRGLGRRKMLLDGCQVTLDDKWSLLMWRWWRRPRWTEMMTSSTTHRGSLESLQRGSQCFFFSFCVSLDWMCKVRRHGDE